MMDNDEFKECVRECTRECEDRECRTDAPGELGEGILFLCSIAVSYTHLTLPTIYSV